MNAEQIRATMVELLSRALLATTLEIDSEGRATTAVRTNAEAADVAVSTLAAAGMLPTGEVWGVRYRGWALDVRILDDENKARRHVAARPQDVLVRTWAHEWTEVTE